MSASGPLVGRQGDLAEITAALDASASGRGGVLLLVGEPGIGKTRLMQEAARLGEERGHLVTWGRGWELGGAPAFWPWIEALRELSRVTGRQPPHLGTTGDTDRFLAFDAVLAFLRESCADRPVLLLLDDLHAADAASLLLAEFVARPIDALRLLLVASHRDVEARATEERWSALSRLGRNARTLRPARLSRDEVGALVRALHPQPVPELTDMVQDTSGGNPLFVRELVQLIAARSRATGRLDVPEGVRAVIRQRLGLLSASAVALLEAAAVVGREFALPLVSEVAGVTPARLVEALAEARATDLVEEAGPGRYRFSHVLVAELLARELPPDVRARQYRRTAEALERLHADDPDAPVDDIATHYLEAGPEAAGPARRAAVRAAERALVRLAFEDAATWFGRALDLLGLDAPGDAPARAELLLGQGLALLRAGSRDAAVATCTKVVELGRALESSELIARAALVLGSEVNTGISDRTLIAFLEEARASLPATDGALRAQVLARLGGARQPEADPEGPMAVAREGIAMARRLGDPEVLLPVLHFANAALVDYAPRSEQIALNQEVIALANTPATRPLALRAHLRLAFAQIAGAEVEAFERTSASFERLLVDYPHPRFLWQQTLLRSMRPLWEGRYAEVARLEAEAWALVERARDDNGYRVRIMRQVLVSTQRTAYQELDATLRAFEHLSPEPIVRDLFTTWGAVQARTPHSSVACRALLAHPKLDRILLDGNLAMGLADVVVAALLDPDLETNAPGLANARALAERLYAMFLPQAGTLMVTSGLGFAVQDLLDRVLALLTEALGKSDAADRHAADAFVVARRLGARPFIARLATERAEALLRRGDTEGATGLAAEARPIAEALDLPGLRARLEALASDTKHPVAAPRAPLPPTQAPRAEVITATRDGELWMIEGRDERCHLKDSRGVRMLAQLLAAPGQELHALDLSGATTVDAGDAGEVLDAEARSAYGARAAELREELAEAEAHNDTGRIEHLTEELDALTTQLASAVGLGGRARRSGSAAERARVNVQRRITDAIKRIESAAPRLGNTLAATIHTGVYCVYRPLN